MRHYILEMRLIDYMCQEKKKEDIPDSVDASIQRLEYNIEKRRHTLITATRNKTHYTRINRTEITRKQKWERKTTLWMF